MANPEHLAVLKQGVETWNKWRQEYPESVPDLEAANLRRTALSGANFRGARLLKADFRQADLTSSELRDSHLVAADLRRANLASANLSHSRLFAADLSWSTLRNVNLFSADITGADFSVAELSGADFTEARAWQTQFGNVDLSEVKGLEEIRHRGPSTIGIDTLYKSKGKIPGVFLRGCGVPDEFIAYIGSMVGRRFEYYSCFISYSTRDQEFAERLYADLQAKGVRCWFAPHDIQGGRKIHEQLDEAIRSHDKLLLILSPSSMGSNWVKTEIADALERGDSEEKQMLFPITLAPFDEVKKWKLFDADRGIDSARVVREYFIPDFSNWKDDDSYQKAFQRLVRDLKNEALK